MDFVSPRSHEPKIKFLKELLVRLYMLQNMIIGAFLVPMLKSCSSVEEAFVTK